MFFYDTNSQATEMSQRTMFSGHQHESRELNNRFRHRLEEWLNHMENSLEEVDFFDLLSEDEDYAQQQELNECKERVENVLGESWTLERFEECLSKGLLTEYEDAQSVEDFLLNLEGEELLLELEWLM